MSNKKHFGLLALTLASFSAMIGSGWLFGAWKAARLAGPASLLAWPIGAVAIGLLAFAYAELGARYPAIGGMARYTQLSHGSFAGFLAGWANWIAIVAVIAIEAVSSVQYLSSFSSAWFRGLYNMPAHHLTPSGLVLSAVFIVFYFLVNYWSVTLFMRSMLAITFFKIAVPLITCAALFISATMDHSFHFTQTAFMPYGFSGVLTAVSTAGVIFSFQGFQSAINLSGEAKNPKRNVPLAILFSLLGATVLYIILQYVFVGAVSSQAISQGWRNLNMSSPYVHLALSLQLNWLVLLLYLDAVVSPSGTAITYTATTSRMLYAMRGNGYMPAFLGKLHRRYRIPRGAMWVNLVVSFLFLFVFKGWSKLVAVISVSTIISYLNGPISAVALRRWKTKAKNPLKIKGLVFIAPLAFVMISLVLYWARWPLTGEVILIMLLGLPVYFYYQHKNKWLNFKENLITGSWLFLYLMVIAVISWIGSREFGGMGWLSMTDSIMLVITVALIFYYYGLRSAFRFINAKMIAEKKAARRKARQKAKTASKKVDKKK
jgi:amino acid transporter